MHYRKRRRLEGHDYSALGHYFLTFSTLDRVRCLSDVCGDEVKLRPAGRCLEIYMMRIAERFVGMSLVSSVIMPDHVHLLIEIHTQTEHTIHDLLCWLKSAASRAAGYKLWQPGSYDAIIRDPAGVERVTHYIQNNPAKWSARGES